MQSVGYINTYNIFRVMNVGLILKGKFNQHRRCIDRTVAESLRNTVIQFSIWLEIYLILDTITSSIGPPSPPIKWSSSTMKRMTCWTILCCFHIWDKASHFSGVLIIIWHFSRSFKSFVDSPVSSTTLSSNPLPNFCSQ